MSGADAERIKRNDMYDKFRRPEVVVYFVSQDRVDDSDLHEELKALIRLINNMQGSTASSLVE